MLRFANIYIARRIDVSNLKSNKIYTTEYGIIELLFYSLVSPYFSFTWSEVMFFLSYKRFRFDNKNNTKKERAKATNDRVGHVKGEL